MLVVKAELKPTQSFTDSKSAVLPIKRFDNK